MARLALTVGSILALLLIAALLPVAGAREATLEQRTETVQPLPWPAWAHPQARAVAAPTNSQTVTHTLSTAASGEHQETLARMSPGRAGTRAGLPRQHEALLQLPAATLQGVTGLVPTPPPRAA